LPAGETRDFPNPTPSQVRQLNPMLLWIDSETSDPIVLNEIRKAHPTLDVSFTSTYSDAERYLKYNLRDIQERDKFIVICRGFYASESKNFVDITRLFENSNPGKNYIGVYTRNRTNLLAKIPNPPQGIDVFESRKDFCAFVNRILSQRP
jgi:hypothetical protein